MDALPDIAQHDAAALLYSALQIIGTLDAACIIEREYNAPLPRGMLSCGEALTLVPALVVLLLRAFPQLNDAEEFRESVNLALMHVADSEVN